MCSRIKTAFVIMIPLSMFSALINWSVSLCIDLLCLMRFPYWTTLKINPEVCSSVLRDTDSLCTAHLRPCFFLKKFHSQYQFHRVSPHYVYAYAQPSLNGVQMLYYTSVHWWGFYSSVYWCYVSTSEFHFCANLCPHCMGIYAGFSPVCTDVMCLPQIPLSVQISFHTVCIYKVSLQSCTDILWLSTDSLFVQISVHTVRIHDIFLQCVLMLCGGSDSTSV